MYCHMSGMNHTGNMDGDIKHNFIILLKRLKSELQRF